MALPAAGFRTVLSMMQEISLHLVEPIVYTTMTTAVDFGGYGTGGYGQGGYGGGTPNPVTVTVGSLGIPIPALYPGAEIVIDVGNNQEIVSVISVDPVNKTFTANFVFAHAIGTLVQGATFPVQAESGDPFFTQTEILSYIARAQNNFLADVPCVVGINTQFIQFGQIYQQLICDSIETVRMASSAQYISLTSLTRGGTGGYGTGGYGGGGYGAGANTNLVTAISQSPHNLLPGQKFSVTGTFDPSFVGAFRVLAVIDAVTFTYIQALPNASTTGGAVVLWLRLYETSQEELGIQNPFWRNQNISQIASYFEDRTGVYHFGVNGKPSVSLPLEVMVATRDTDVLSMTDGFLIPDVVLHYTRYRALEFIFQKDGEQRDPIRERYCAARYARGVATTKRWLTGMGVSEEMQAVNG